MYIEIDFSSNEALYSQLCNQIILGIATSQYHQGDPLPSVRTLADTVGINMHTVNKAYSILRQEGYVKVDRRKGAVIAVDADRARALAGMERELLPVVARGICRGISLDEMHGLLDELYGNLTKDL